MTQSSWETRTKGPPCADFRTAAGRDPVVAAGPLPNAGFRYRRQSRFRAESQAERSSWTTSECTWIGTTAAGDADRAVACRRESTRPTSPPGRRCRRPRSSPDRGRHGAGPGHRCGSQRCSHLLADELLPRGIVDQRSSAQVQSEAPASLAGEKSTRDLEQVALEHRGADCRRAQASMSFHSCVPARSEASSATGCGEQPRAVFRRPQGELHGNRHLLVERHSRERDPVGPADLDPPVVRACC